MTEEQEKNDEFFSKLSQNTLILRRNLMATSALVLVVLLLGLEIDPSPILEIEITGLTKEKTYFVALILLLYFTVHFGWSAWNELGEKWLQSFKWGKQENDVYIIPSPNNPLQRLKREVHKLGTTGSEPLRIEEQANQMDIFEDNIKKIERSRRWLLTFEIGLPLAMGGVAIAWLVWLILVWLIFA